MAGVFAVAGCNKDIEPGQVAEQTVKFTINTSAPETKTYIEYDENAHTYTPNWYSDDQIGVFVDSWANNENPKATLSNTKPNGPTGSFSGSLTTTTGAHTLYAFYPAGQFDKAYNDRKIGITIPETQMPTATSFDKGADLLVATSYPLTVSGSSVVIDDMQFTRVVSLLKVVVSDGTADGRLASDAIQSITLTSGMQDAALTGRFVWDFANGTGTMDSGERSASIKADLSANPIAVDGANSIYLLVNPTTLTSGSQLEVSIQTDNHTVSKTATLPKNFIFPAGNVANLSITITDSDTVEEIFTPGWYLVTSVSELQAGDKVVITNASSTKAVGAQTNTNYRDRVDVALKADMTLDVKTASQFTLVNGSKTGTFAFQEGNKLLNATSGSNYLQSKYSDVRDNTSWRITISNAGTTIFNVSATAYEIQENIQSNDRFSCYKSTQGAVLLYKYYDGSSTPEPGEPSITALKTVIADVPAAGGSLTESAVYSLTDAEDSDITVTTDGTVVTSATATLGNISFTVAANTGATRNGWIRLSLSEESEIEIAVGQHTSLTDWASVQTSNVTMAKGTNAYDDVTVNGNSAIKVGTSSAGGTMTITIPANTTLLYFHAISWNNVPGLKVSVTGNNATPSPAYVYLTTSSSVSGNSPYTVSNPSNYFFAISLPDNSTETTLTLEADKRFLIWGCNVDGGGSGSGDPETATVTTGLAEPTSYSATLNATFKGVSTEYAPQGAWFTYGTSPDALNNTAYTQNVLAGPSGSFSASIASLASDQDYYFRAYMTVWDGTEYVTIESEVIHAFRTRPVTPMATPSWMELPVMAAYSDAVFYAHDLSGAAYTDNSTGYRNWSCYWSPTHGVSYWVAYPMFDVLNAPTVKRTDAFGYDPIVPQAEQPNLSGGSYGQDSYGTSYSRGHQIPSMDRRSSTTVNETTFYATNMTPQTSSFNGGIWNQLEQQVNTWANSSDTLYVVTGCIVDGSTRTVADHAGNGSFTVPTHYYKALLRLKNGTYSGRAYLFNHFGSYVSSQYENYAISIDELETETGIDFFPNLIYKVGSVEAAAIEQTKANW